MKKDRLNIYYHGHRSSIATTMENVFTLYEHESERPIVSIQRPPLDQEDAKNVMVSVNGETELMPIDKFIDRMRVLISDIEEE